MKKNLICTLISLALLAGIMSSCNKTVGPGPVSSTFMIVNAIPGASALVANFKGNAPLIYYRSAQQIPIASSTTPYYEFGGYIGDYPLAISQFTDTLHTLVKCNIHLDAGTAHTLFLTGTLTAPDTAFTTDNLTAITDSVVKIRFINLSPGSVPISVNLSGSSATPIATGLGYKATTQFIPVSIKKAAYITASSTYAYLLEFRNASTNALLASYSLGSLYPVSNASGARLFKNVTVALKGTATAPGVIAINHF